MLWFIIIESHVIEAFLVLGSVYHCCLWFRLKCIFQESFAVNARLSFYWSTQKLNLKGTQANWWMYTGVIGGHLMEIYYDAEYFVRHILKAYSLLFLIIWQHYLETLSLYY